MSTLYEISEDLQAIDQLLMEIGGDVSDEQVDEAIKTWLNESTGELDAKTDNYCRFIKELEAQADARKTESQRLADLAGIGNNAAARLKARLKWFMEEHDIKKIDTKSFNVYIAQNGGVLPLCINCEPEQMPLQYRHIIYQADGVRIRKALDDGKQLYFASYADRGFHLRIR